MTTPYALFERIIGAIGEADFVASTGRALCDFAGFDLAAVLHHPVGAAPAILFDNFDRAGGRTGIAAYARTTYRINPMLARQARGAVRARDFAASTAVPDAMRPDLVRSADEELGFRTLGWPERQEEIGLYVEAWDGLIELSFYRDRGRRSAPDEVLHAFSELGAPIAAAFERHGALGSHRDDRSGPSLTPRENEVRDLLLAGCTSEAIARRLGISRHTVKDHRKHIFRKLGVGSLAELFALDRSPPWEGWRAPTRWQ
jgi:DNA-binding CsgD family transcriptional regulator